MQRTWTKALKLWVPIVVGLTLVAESARLWPGVWIIWPVVMPERLLCLFLLTTEGGGVRSTFDWIQYVIALLYWPFVLLPLLGWLKTRKRIWFIPQALVVLAHIGLLAYFVLLFLAIRAS